MLISSISNYYKSPGISFNANKVSTHTIKKINNDGTESDYDADFIKFDLKSDNDKKFFEDLLNDPDYNNDNNEFTNDIADDFRIISQNKNSRTDFFGLVKPQTNYDSVDKTNLLGLIEVCNQAERKISYVDYLQSMPECMYGNESRTYKKVGESLLDGVVGLTDNDIELTADDDAVPFYEYYGFYNVEDMFIPNLMRYKNKKTKTLDVRV